MKKLMAFLAVLLVGSLAMAQNVPNKRLAAGRLFIGNANNIAAPVAPSGDLSLSNTGVVTITDLTITNERAGELLGFDGTNWRTFGHGYTKIQGSWVAPSCSIAAGSAATGADTTVTNCSLGYHYPPMVIYNTGANTTRIAPATVVDANCTDGLMLPSTDTDNVGGTITFGAALQDLLATAGGPTTFTVGTDAAFYLKAKIGIPDISDYDVFFFGFVEPAAAYVAAIDTPAEIKTAYDEKAGFSLADNAGDVDIDTSLAGVDVNTDITVTDWTDDDVMTMQINVSAAGAVTYRWWDAAGAEDTSTGAVAFSFADTTVVTPMIIFAKGAAAADTPPIVEYIEWGYQ